MALDASAPFVLPTVARLMFAAILLVYFWASARTKFGTGIFSPSDGAYVQIFPRTAEAFGYDFSKFTTLHWLVVTLGTWAEVLLPLLIVVGLFTRLAALGMIGFILVQSATDIYGHGVGGGDLGAWFDRHSDAVILDQRGLWVFLLLVLVVWGAGAISIDAVLNRYFGARSQGS